MSGILLDACRTLRPARRHRDGHDVCARARRRVYVLGFAVSCAAASVYAALIHSWPFAAVEAVWALIALKRWSGTKENDRATQLTEDAHVREADRSRRLAGHRSRRAGQPRGRVNEVTDFRETGHGRLGTHRADRRCSGVHLRRRVEPEGMNRACLALRTPAE